MATERVFVSDDIRARAASLADRMGILKNSIVGGSGTVAGFVGEAVLAEYLGCPSVGEFDYDLSYRGRRIEVKTKRTRTIPAPHYECSVPLLNDCQQCDYYAFARVSYDLGTAWILGFLPRNIYFQNAELRQKGDYDPRNDHWVLSSCYNVSIKQLWPIEWLKRLGSGELIDYGLWRETHGFLLKDGSKHVYTKTFGDKIAVINTRNGEPGDCYAMGPAHDTTGEGGEYAVIEEYDADKSPPELKEYIQMCMADANENIAGEKTAGRGVVPQEPAGPTDDKKILRPKVPDQLMPVVFPKIYKGKTVIMIGADGSMRIEVG